VYLLLIQLTFSPRLSHWVGHFYFPVVTLVSTSSYLLIDPMKKRMLPKAEVVQFVM